MRSAYLLIAALVLCGFAAGYLALSFKTTGAEPIPFSHFLEVRNEFQQTHKETHIFAWSELEQVLPGELRDLKTALPQTS
ncbi:MAG: hypothetical protein JWL77_7023, partial [Chthonomonadaceae bacterium]|nr:hypothetical protein [Chthonomonadaceae bacterium]